MAKEVAPQLGLDSFSCPHCGALAHQHWSGVFVSSYEKGTKPLPLDRAKVDAIDLKGIEDKDDGA